MATLNRKFLTALLLLAPATTLRLMAADKLDLERVIPVPAGETIPVIDFFRPALLDQPVLNPSGTHIAAIIAAGEDHHQLLVYELKTQKTESAGWSGDKDINRVSWLDDRRLLFGLNSRKLFSLGLLATNVGSLNSSYPLLQYYGSELIAVPHQNRLRPLVWNRYDSLGDGGQHDLGVAVIDTDLRAGSLIDLTSLNTGSTERELARKNNESHIVDSYPQPTGGLVDRYVADREGRLEFGITAQDGISTIHQLTEGHWKKCPIDLDAVQVLESGDQPGQLLVVGPRQDGKPRALQYQDAATGTLGEVLLQDKAYDFNGWVYRDPVSRLIVGAMYERNGPQTVWFNDNYRSLQKILDGFFPGVVVRILGNDEAGKTFLVGTFSDRQPFSYSWVNLETRTAGLIKRSAPWIDPQRMQPKNILRFKTRDGHQLDAYLTLPAGASKQNPPPLVVLPHSGRIGRSSWSFNSEVQFLASRGYAVLEPNYRGSAGYTGMFPIEDEWAYRKMADDVTDATKMITASGLVDRQRVAIMGTLFDGYLALSGAAYEPDLYRCAVAVSAVPDWGKLIADEKSNKFLSSFYTLMVRKLGDPGEDPGKWDAIAPLRHADQIRCPLFYSTSEYDGATTRIGLKDLASAVERNHIPVESAYFAEEINGVQHLRGKVELYTRIEAFLAKHLLPAKSVAPAGAAP